MRALASRGNVAWGLCLLLVAAFGYRLVSWALAESERLRQPPDSPEAALDCIHPEFSRGADIVGRCAATQLPACDQVEILALAGPWSESLPQRLDFPSLSPMKQASVLSRRLLSPAEATALLALWRKQAFDPHSGAICHFPKYGFLCRVGAQVVLEWSICFACSNIGYIYPHTEFAVGPAFLDNAPQTLRMREFLSALLPHPDPHSFRENEPKDPPPVD